MTKSPPRSSRNLEDGRVPWVQPWGTDHVNAALGLPKNATTHRPYSGINILILWRAVIEGGYSCQHWLTLKQGNMLEAKVRKGAIFQAASHASKAADYLLKFRASDDSQGGGGMTWKSPDLLGATPQALPESTKNQLQSPDHGRRP